MQNTSISHNSYVLFRKYLHIQRFLSCSSTNPAYCFSVITQKSHLHCRSRPVKLSHIKNTRFSCCCCFYHVKLLYFLLNLCSSHGQVGIVLRTHILRFFFAPRILFTLKHGHNITERVNWRTPCLSEGYGAEDATFGRAVPTKYFWTYLAQQWIWIQCPGEGLCWIFSVVSLGEMFQMNVGKPAS